ncbi:hypothetical protein NDU88_006048 [Pleurodeles waltl]|uniref:Uncharacterized protein n=1 Tax=Pleurodeles waltl TaxID=8319 RepID=A0AAV7TYZ5_PLEWA|nr:hypothetical protein NDU88_006048 [Pleurodeles waltl]
MRVRWRPQATNQARSLNPAIITTGGLKNCREAIGEYTAQAGTAALHFGAEIAPPKKKIPLTSSRLPRHKMATATEQEISYSRGPRSIEERKGLSHFCH